MSALKELIAEGEHICSELVEHLETGNQVQTNWETVVSWYAASLDFAKKHSKRSTADLPPPDNMENPSQHHAKIDRLLSRLRGIEGSKNEG